MQKHLAQETSGLSDIEQYSSNRTRAFFTMALQQKSTSESAKKGKRHKQVEV